MQKQISRFLFVIMFVWMVLNRGFENISLFFPWEEQQDTEFTKGFSVRTQEIY